jgi:phage terminase large subunit
VSAAVAPATSSVRTAVEKLRAWRRDPVRFVRDVFRAEPDAWQLDALQAVASGPKVAMSACKGPGKSCLLAWVIWWFLAVHHDAQVIGVSITADNLRDNLWKELAVWRSKSELLQRAFEYSAERVKSADRPSTWWASARAFAQSADPTQQANTLAGFHGENVLVVLDEVGDYPEGVLAAAEAIFANEVNAKLVVAGNPTRTDGPLYRIVTRDAARWHVITITGDPDDPKRSPRISSEWARSEIERWGRDNPWVMVNILGQFPPAASDQLIAINDVIAAMERKEPALGTRTDARVWGLDPARFGDDEAVLARRQGTVSGPMKVWRSLDGTQLGDAVAKLLLEAQKQNAPPDTVFVDVGGVGASAYDRLCFLGWRDVVRPVDFGGSAIDARFLNKRAEIWWAMNEWLKTMPASLPHDPVLQSELTAPRFWFRTVNKRTAFALEPKEDLKSRGVPSPNRADALALTFAAPVSPRSRHAPSESFNNQRCETDYDPLARG